MGFTKASAQCDMDENVSESKAEYESQLWSCGYETVNKPLKTLRYFTKIIFISFIILRDRTEINEETNVSSEEQQEDKFPSS